MYNYIYYYNQNIIRCKYRIGIAIFHIIAIARPATINFLLRSTLLNLSYMGLGGRIIEMNVYDTFHTLARGGLKLERGVTVYFRVSIHYKAPKTHQLK